MRILFLTQILPYPPNAGPRVKTWQVLKHLAQAGHQIHLVSFVREDEIEFVPVVSEICEKTITVHMRRNRINDLFFGIKSLFSGKPFLVERDNLPEMKNAIRKLISHNDYDVIHADQLSMAQFAWQARQLVKNLKIRNIPRLLFDAHNATWTIMDRMQTHIPSIMRPILSLEKRKIRNYEGWLVDHFDHTLAVSEIDSSALLIGSKNKSNGKISVIPIAIDTQTLSPILSSTTSYQLLTIGTLHYPPNADGIRWFINEVFPAVLKEIPQVTLTIIGKNPPKDFYELAKTHSPSIEITGYVADLTPYLEKTAILIVPVLAGGGMRVRILEGFSRQLAIITTTVGLEGIDAENNKDIIVRDDPMDFSQAIVHLIKDRSRIEQIALSGRKLVESKYDSKVVYEKLDFVYQNITRSNST
jgi:glycosyltransferase involved in cell wall biosynthesis